MKKLLLASTALVALGGQALAADLPVGMPVKAPIAAPIPVFSWTGCYVGGHVGVGWGRKDFSEPTEPFGQNFAPVGSSINVDTGAGFLGGGQIGCDYQFAGNWVIGARGDFAWAHITGQSSDPFFAGKTINSDGSPITLNAKTDALATVVGRLGYGWDRFMLYGTSGAAWARDKYSITNLPFWGAGLNQANVCANSTNTQVAPCNPTGSETRLGWTVGVGFEWAIAGNWSLLVEFNHYDFGSRSVTLTALNGAGPGTVTIPLSGSVDIKQRIEAVKLGFNYRFGWDSAVAARY